MIKSVISDLGKVIIFFDNKIFFRKISAYCPFSPEETAAKVMDHIGLIHAFDSGKLAPEEFYQRATRILQAKISFEDFYPIYNDVFSLNPPALEVIKRLKPKYRLVLLSNTDVMRYGFIQKRFPEIQIFDDYVLSFEVGTMKPDAKIYEVALKKAEARPDECVFIDDREENTTGAERVGISSILFGPETDLEAELRSRGLFF